MRGSVTAFHNSAAFNPIHCVHPTPGHSIRLIAFPGYYLFDFPILTMANPQILLANLRAGRCSDTTEVRLLRFWEARNVRRGGDIMSIYMLFVDDASILTQASVSANSQLRLKERLIEGSIYTFMPYSRLIELANTGKQLHDILGELTAIRSTITDRIPGAQRVMLTLRLLSAESVCVSMFDSMALAFHTKLDSYEKEPRVIIATSLNPKIVGDVEMANLTSIHASEAAQVVGIGVDARVNTDLPRCLADIVGKTYTFQLKLNDFNFSSKHQTFTISRIFPQRALAPMPAFAIADGVNVPEVTLPGAVATGTIIDVGESRTVADGPSGSDVSTGKRPAPAKDEVGVNETAQKRQHVE